jgi:Bacterial Ig domain
MKRILLYAACLLLLACRREVAEDVVQPSVIITAPAASQHFTNGQIIHIRGTASDDRGLTEVAIHIANKITGDEFYHNHKAAAGKSYPFGVTYTVPNALPATYLIEVEVTDHAGNTVTEEMTITVN